MHCVDSFQPVGFALTFIRYSRDSVSVQHSIQEGVWRLGNLEKQKEQQAALVRKNLGYIWKQNGWNKTAYPKWNQT